MSISSFFVIRSMRKLIFISCLVGFLLTIMSWDSTYFFWVPDFLLMVLFFWLLHQPASIQLGIVFLLGLAVDFCTNTSLGLHALGYVCAGFVILARRNRIRVFHFGIQSVIIVLALLLAQIVMAIVWSYQTHQWVSWRFFISPLLAILIWPVLNKIIMSVPAFKHQL